MPELEGTTTHQNLVATAAIESQTVQRYLWFAQQADIEGRPEIAALFRSIADSETGHVQGVLDFLAGAGAGDPLTGTPIDGTDDYLRSAVAGEQAVAEDSYPSFARAARAEGFDAIADWFESLARAERSQLGRLRQALGSD